MQLRATVKCVRKVRHEATLQLARRTLHGRQPPSDGGPSIDLHAAQTGPVAAAAFRRSGCALQPRVLGSETCRRVPTLTGDVLYPHPSAAVVPEGMPREAGLQEPSCRPPRSGGPGRRRVVDWREERAYRRAPRSPKNKMDSQKQNGFPKTKWIPKETKWNHKKTKWISVC